MAEIENSGKYAPKHLKLIEACKRGERKAQFELYRLYSSAMYNTSLRIVRDPDDAEDVMQEAFLKAFSRIGTYRKEVSFGAWLKRIVVNKSLDFLRLRRESLSLEDVGDYEEIPEDDHGTMEYAYSADDIRKAIQSLPEGYRIVLSLILLEGYDHEEVSEILQITNATSRTQYHRAKKRLAELLRNLEKNNE